MPDLSVEQSQRAVPQNTMSAAATGADLLASALLGNASAGNPASVLPLKMEAPVMPQGVAGPSGLIPGSVGVPVTPVRPQVPGTAVSTGPGFVPMGQARFTPRPRIPVLPV